jgi:hypothetical protein
MLSASIMKRLRPHCEKSYGVAPRSCLPKSRTTPRNKPAQAAQGCCATATSRAATRSASHLRSRQPTGRRSDPPPAESHRPVLAADGSNLRRVHRSRLSAWSTAAGTCSPASQPAAPTMRTCRPCPHLACPRGPAAECPEGDDR